MARERYYVGSTGPFFFDPTETRPDGTTQSALSIGGQTAGSERVDIVGTRESNSQSTEGFLTAEVDGSTGRIAVGGDREPVIDAVTGSLTSPTHQVGYYEVDLKGETGYLRVHNATQAAITVIAGDLPDFSASTTKVATTTTEIEIQFQDFLGNPVSERVFIRTRITDQGGYLDATNAEISAVTGDNTEVAEALTNKKDLILKSNSTGLFTLRVSDQTGDAWRLATGPPPLLSKRAAYDVEVLGTH